MKLCVMIPLFFLSCSVFAKSTLERVQNLPVSSLQGNTTVYYSHNARMSDVVFTQNLVANAIEFYTQAPEIATKLKIYPAILNQADWENLPVGEGAMLIPYGIPALSDDKPYVAFIGATDDNILADYNLRMESILPQKYKDAIAQAGFTYAEGAHIMPFLVAIHEMGHGYLRELGIAYPTNPAHTIDELMANYLLYAFLRIERPNMAVLWDNILEGYVVTQCPAYTSIRDFDDYYMGIAEMGGPGNFFWYQGMTQRLAKTLYESEGLAFIEKIKQVKGLSRDQAYTKLSQLSPDFRKWVSEFGPEKRCP